MLRRNLLRACMTGLALLVVGFWCSHAAWATVTWYGEVDPADPTTLTSSSSQDPEFDAYSTNALIVGWYDAPSLVTVASGSTLTTNFGFLGLSDGSQGTVTVTGSGSLWDALGVQIAGDNGPGYGTLNVSDHGLLSLRNEPGYGNFTIGSAAGSGVPDGGMGIVNITTGGTISSNGPSGDTISTNLPGQMNIDGAGSTWLTTQSPTIGWSNGGSLTITNGGQAISNGTWDVKVAGWYNFESSVITVDGSGSLWDIGNAQSLQLGMTSTGILNLSDGGTMVCSTIIGGLVSAEALANLGVTWPCSGGVMEINFDGGILKSNGTSNVISSGTNSSDGWISNIVRPGWESFATKGEANIYVKAGGATFDTSGHDMGISMALTGHTASTGGGVTKIGAGALTLSGVNTYTGLTTVAAGTLELEADAQSAVLAGGADIQSGKMIFDYSGTAPGVGALVAASFSGGTAAWTTGTFLSTTADATHGLGWNDNGADQVTVMYTLYGDSNLDGSVNGTDLNAVLSYYNQSSQVWTSGDFNYDGSVNGTDLNTVLSNYNQSLSASTAAVPEPSTLLLLVLGLVGLLAARRVRTCAHQ